MLFRSGGFVAGGASGEAPSKCGVSKGRLWGWCCCYGGEEKLALCAAKHRRASITYWALGINEHRLLNVNYLFNTLYHNHTCNTHTHKHMHSRTHTHIHAHTHIQAMLRMHGGTRQPGSLPCDLAIEARDTRTASDIVLQILSYRCVRVERVCVCA